MIGLSQHPATAAPSSQHHSHRPATPRAYARRVTLHRWHALSEWRALDAIIRPESAWNPCARYPSTRQCDYDGPNACGVPQANPCPTAWRGQLYATRWAQVRWLIVYVSRRYGDPLGALAYRQAHGSY